MRSLTRVGLFVMCVSIAVAGWPLGAAAQGVTTGSVAGVVRDAQQRPVAGASVIAIHEPSGTSYEGVTREDGRFSILNMRVGGPYSVTVAYTGGGGTAFEPQTLSDIVVNLGVASDLEFTVREISVTETVTVTAQSDNTFSSARTGAATAVTREDLVRLPTLSMRLQDVTRISPQAGANLSFAGQDNRLNNITVDGSYFNNSFGIGSAPGERTGTAPISFAAIEQIQINIAPYDVRQGNFVGAGVNTVTRSGTNQFTGSVYHMFRDEGLVGTEAAGLTVNPGTFTYRNTGVWGGGPILRNRLFAFGNYEDEGFTQPGTTYVANAGGQTVGGNVTRVLSSDLQQLSSLLNSRFGYEAGPFQEYDHDTPVVRGLLKFDYNLNQSNKVNFRYTHLDSITDVPVSNSSSLGFGSRRTSTLALNFQNSNYQIIEDIRSSIGEWNALLGDRTANSLIVGYTHQDESRKSRGQFFPFVDILDGVGATYTSFGFEPFTPNNELRYSTFQLQDNLTRYVDRHTLTFGGSFERYESENIFFPGSQSVYTYNSLADFYADIADLSANPNRTVSPVTLRRFQVRWSNIPGLDVPIQPLKVSYSGAYAQDEWAVNDNLKITGGIRLDVPVFAETGFANALADALTFRDETGAGVQYSTAKLPDPNVLWSPRVGVNWNLDQQRRTQVRGGTGIFTGRPAYVWISNQIGNTGVLTGFEQLDNTTARPFSPDPNRYKPSTVTGAPASSYELALTDPDFKFPQVWRSNIAVDRRLPFDLTATGEFLYTRDVNGVYYINANLPAAQTNFVGADARQRWTNNRIFPQVQNAIVLKNQNEGRSWNIAGTLERRFGAGFIKGAYSYTEAENTVDPGSIAFGSWNNNPHSGDPNNPGLAYATSSPGHRLFATGSYRGEYFGFGGTTISAFWEMRNGGNASYVFAGDLNGDGGTSNDLLYIHRNTAEMNFQPFTVGGRTFSAEEQAQAWNTYIEQDDYLRERRGEYARRGATFLPLLTRMDLSIAQDVFVNIAGRRNSFQFRADIFNVGNLLNSDWGVGDRYLASTGSVIQPLTNAGVDAQGRATYRMRVLNNELLTRSLEPTALLDDVYRVQFSLRYTF